MAKLEITLDLDNAAFEYLPDNESDEVSRILAVIASRVEEARYSYGKVWLVARDINGNSVGKFRVSP